MVMDPESPVGADRTTMKPPAGMDGERGPLFRLVRDERVAFLIVGAINTVLGTAWFVFFQAFVFADLGGLNYMASLIAAHICAVLCAFILYRKFVFRVQGHVWLDLARFELVNLSALAVNVVALPAVVHLLRIPPIPAQILITCATALISYFGHKGFSFRRAKPAPAPDTPPHPHHEGAP
jgi:putative flippase GtrA